MNIQTRIEQAIATATGTPVRFAQSRPVAGGCINDSRVVTLDNGLMVFVKTHANPPVGMFDAEYQALRLIAAVDVIRVPRPIAVADDFIVMEAFHSGSRCTDWQELLGRRLAQLHQAAQTERFGFEQNNYLGTSLQPNGWLGDWVDFWRERRLGWQLRIFADSGNSGDPLLQLGEKLIERLDEILAEPQEPAVLLHGDLWSGNAAADEKGEPIIFDPASYYGRREAEIGMMRLFGGFDKRCETAYNEVWPLADGADRRIACYRLYHELNHLNLFGGGYYRSCLKTIQQLL
jgi:fructosamine-3-kinase